jgi:alpha-L-rhamnosidase
MKRALLLLPCILLSCNNINIQKNKISVTSLNCEYKVNPSGISSQNPRLGWKLKSDLRNQRQSAYRILVSDDLKQLRSDIGNIWDSEKRLSESSILISYDGIPLISGNKYYWKVKVWNQDNDESAWSEISTWQMGLLNETDWSNAQWIGYEEMPDSLRLVPGNHGPQNHLGAKAIKRPVTPLFRKEFQAAKKIDRAILFISGLGQYEATINAKKIGNGFLTPGWTYYDKTVLYNVYDVTKSVKTGKNVIGVIVGNGFYNINRERYFKINITFGMPKMIAKLYIKYTDGSEDNIVSGTDWKTFPSAITFNSIYGGEDYDARLEQAGWNLPDFNDSRWNNALLVKKPFGKLAAESDYPLRIMEELRVKKIEKISHDKFVYDFGQNASGIIEIKVKGEKGQEVRFIPGEIVNPDKSVIQNSDISGAPYYFSYMLKGNGVETWRPRFTYYGFRYVQVEGAVPDSKQSEMDLPKLIDLKMLHTRNSAPEVGHFDCSNELMNKINSMIKWSIRSNLVSILTDCPHREKLGWLEVTHLLGDAIHYNTDIYHLYSKLINDMMESQTPEGLVPTIAPEFALMDRYYGDYRDAPVWGSASVVLPWLIYKWYGDTAVMQKAWPMMNKYIEYLKTRSKNLIIVHGLGDWCELNPNEPGPRITPTSLLGTSQFYYDVKLLIKMASILGNQEEQEKITTLSEQVKKAFNKEFFNENTCIYATGSQASLAVPLAVGLVDSRYYDRVFENLINKIKEDNKILTVGSAGIRYLLEVLMDRGASQLFFDMNNRDDAGYGLQLKMGATTLIEPWIPSTEHGSNNHPALGNIMRWFYEGLGGIDQEENGNAYKEILIHPQLVDGIMEVKSSFESPYGLIRSEWEKQNGSFYLKIEIPVNVTAKIYFPECNAETIIENDKPVQKNEDIEIIKLDNKNTIIKMGSGKYSFIASID